ncbi:hypothetical protein Desti_1727 [Desulfomonile tiedjei DSM 6799]|uniref:Uncharacterized protein n=1 Tax=Desulfomonile tiedjei (strain ATCC 49306 / DSM 6799 / DCB-1) TaxID=706587 RepID=I4C4E6_DESTA|nr:hypothetical protein Desti_1727 [Desulfomonile tiedjei DSM 6799]
MRNTVLCLAKLHLARNHKRPFPLFSANCGSVRLHESYPQPVNGKIISTDIISDLGTPYPL